MLRWVIFEVIFLGSCGYALWRGGTPERIASATFLVAATLSLFVRQPVPDILVREAGQSQFHQLELGVMAVDLAVLAVMLMLAFASERFWPLWMSAMAGITVLVHMAVMLKLQPVPWAYWRSEALLSYPMQFLLAIATWRHQRRLKLCGTDRSWRRSSVQ